MKIQRRKLLKSIGAFSLAAPALSALAACSPRVGEDNKRPPPETPETPSLQYSNGAVFKPGYLSIIQGPTSDSIAMINMFVPKLKKYEFEVRDQNDTIYKVDQYLRLESPTHWHVVKLRVSGLTPGVKYTLSVYDGKGRQLIDRRNFSSLDITKTNPRFGFLSCMADDNRFDQIIDSMWNRLKDQDVDLLVVSGDVVYVDSFENVERLKATEFDIWQRYIDSLRRIPVYHWENLKPILATWDDHDYGTNDGDRDFIGRTSADKLFHALFFGDNIDGVWTMGPTGTYSVYKAFGQRFFFMDDRSFRQPNKNQTTQEPYGHWGEEQHHWLMKNLTVDATPSWIFNGNQFFRGAPDDLSFMVESMQWNHPAEFKNLCDGMKNVTAPVVFASGDVHLSEIMQISADKVGYDTFEVTSSSMHSYLGGNPWKNILRMPEMICTEFNFMVIESQFIQRGAHAGLKVNLQTLGMSKQPYFTNSFEVLK